jgi:hypothetical protein
MSKQRLLQMFSEVVIEKNASLIQSHFHPGFILEANGRRQGLPIFLRRRELDYATAVSYEVQFDDRAWIEAADAVGARLWLTVRKPGATANVLELLLLATYRGDRIYRMWQSAWPEKVPAWCKATDRPGEIRRADLRQPGHD